MKKSLWFLAGTSVGVLGKYIYDTIKDKGSNKLIKSFDNLTASILKKVEDIQTKVLEKCESKDNNSEEEKGEK